MAIVRTLERGASTLSTHGYPFLHNYPTWGSPGAIVRVGKEGFDAGTDASSLVRSRGHVWDLESTFPPGRLKSQDRADERVMTLRLAGICSSEDA